MPLLFSYSAEAASKGHNAGAQGRAQGRRSGGRVCPESEKLWP